MKTQQVSNFNKVEAAYLVVFSHLEVNLPLLLFFDSFIISFLVLFAFLSYYTSLPQPLFSSLLPVPSLSSFTDPLFVLFPSEKAMPLLISSKQIWQYIIKLHIESNIKTGKGNPNKRKAILRADKRIRNTPILIVRRPTKTPEQTNTTCMQRTKHTPVWTPWFSLHFPWDPVRPT